jgi:hypothetical protein
VRLREVVCAYDDRAAGDLPGVVFLARLLLDDGFSEGLHRLVRDADNKSLPAGGLGPINGALTIVERFNEIGKRHFRSSRTGSRYHRFNSGWWQSNVLSPGLAARGCAAGDSNGQRRRSFARAAAATLYVIFLKLLR